MAYTYSKCMTDATGYFGGGWGGTQTSLPASFWQNIYDRKAEWGPCYFDQTHILSAYANYQLPFGHGKRMGANMNRVANAVVVVGSQPDHYLAQWQRHDGRLAFLTTLEPAARLFWKVRRLGLRRRAQLSQDRSLTGSTPAFNGLIRARSRCLR